jgi:hypothetical protein
MAVIDLERNQKGIQTLGTEFQDLVAAGHGCVIAHTNGYTYCVFARNYSNAVDERRLYISKSTDNGVTWSAPTQLTSGNWDDNPSGIQLDTSSTTSDIGVVFTRATDPVTINSCTLTRIGIDQSTLALTTPVDPITGSPTGLKYPSLVKVAAGYKIFSITAVYASSADVSVYSNSDFTTNTWTGSTLATFWGSSTLNPFSLRVKRLANGDLAAISVVRTALNGATTQGPGNLPRAIVRTDVYVAFSADDGATWSAVQNLTNYSGTPSLDLIGLTVALDADLTQLSDGTVVVAYQEGITPQYVDSNTTLVLPSNVGNVTCAVYHSGKNYLILGCDDTTNGGLYIFDLTGQTVTHINTASTPAIWGNAVKTMDLSSDEKYLAVGHTAGLEIIDTTDPTISNWTITPIRTTTTPASRVASMHKVRFDSSGYNLYVSYGAASVSNVYGFWIDASAPSSLTDLMATIGGGVANVEFVITSGALYAIPIAGRISKTNKVTGADTYTTNIGGSSSWNTITMDDVNNEIIVTGTQSGGSNGLSRVSDTGSGFSVTQDFNTGTNPSIGSLVLGVAQNRRVNGNGLFYNYGASGATTAGYYSFGIQKPLGWLNFARNDLDLGENAYNSTWQGSAVLKDGSWLLMTNGANAVLISLSKSGRPRYGFFPYNTGTHQLTTTGVDFYDMTNTLHLASYDKLQKISLTSDSLDTLICYFRKADLTIDTGQWSATIAYVEPDTRRLTMRARIRNTYTQTLDMRARIKATYTAALDMRARIVFAQCVYMRARIVPITSQSMTMRARIFARKQTVLENDFLVSAAQVTKMRSLFYATYGNVRNQSLTMKARIAPVYKQRMTSGFIVYNSQSGALMLQQAAALSTLQIMQVKARIAIP